MKYEHENLSNYDKENLSRATRKSCPVAILSATNSTDPVGIVELSHGFLSRGNPYVGLDFGGPPQFLHLYVQIVH
jgi:hypothetical protein